MWRTLETPETSAGRGKKRMEKTLRIFHRLWGKQRHQRKSQGERRSKREKKEEDGKKSVVKKDHSQEKSWNIPIPEPGNENGEKRKKKRFGGG